MAEEYLNIIKIDTITNLSIDKFIAQQKLAAQKMAIDEKSFQKMVDVYTRLKAMVSEKPYCDVLRTKYVDILTKLYTEDEQVTINNFLLSDTGQKFLNTTQQMIGEIEGVVMAQAIYVLLPEAKKAIENK